MIFVSICEERTNRNAENVGLELDQQIVLRHPTIDTQRRHMSTSVASHHFNNVLGLIAHRFQSSTSQMGPGGKLGQSANDSTSFKK